MSAGLAGHRLDAGTISNDLAGWIAEELVRPGLLAPEEFEAAFVSVVESIDPTWKAFYRNTLAALATGGEPGGTIAGMAPVHERAAALALGPAVVELGCCFGFLSLRLAADGHDVTAVDLCRGTVGLLASVAPALGADIRVLAGDATRVPLATGSADTVYAVHLLEHLPVALAPRVLAEMLRVARRRVVVAVPFEAEPDRTWGHVRTVTPADLTALATTTGRPYTLDDHHGGWLTLTP